MMEQDDRWSRRQLLQFTALAGTTAALGLGAGTLTASPAPEVTRINLYDFSGASPAHRCVTEELLRAEGFSHISYIPPDSSGNDVYAHMANGEVDVTHWFSAPFVRAVDRGAPLVFLGELAVDTTKYPHYRCVATGNRSFVEANPVATRRALRTLLKSQQMCAADPERAARFAFERGWVSDVRRTAARLQGRPFVHGYRLSPVRDLEAQTRVLHETGFVTNPPDDILRRCIDTRILRSLDWGLMV